MTVKDLMRAHDLKTQDEQDELMVKLAQDREALLAALKGVIDQFDAGYFVRNTDDDGAPGWTLRAIQPLKVLAAAQSAIEQAEAQ